MNMDFVTVDHLRTGALVVGFLATAFAGKTTWLLTDTIANVFLGVGWFCFPGNCLGFQTVGDLDPYAIMFARAFGVTFIAAAVIMFRLRKSKDDHVHATVMLWRIFQNSVFLTAMGYAQIKYARRKDAHWGVQHVWFSMVGVGLWLAGSLLNYLRMGDWGGHGMKNNRINLHLFFDGLFLAVATVYVFAFPDFANSELSRLTKPNGIHLHMQRIVAATGIGGIVLLWGARAFTNDDDKRTVLLGRTVMHVLCFIVIGLHQYLNSVMTTGELYKYYAISGVVVLNCILGCFSGQSDKTKRA